MRVSPTQAATRERWRAYDMRNIRYSDSGLVAGRAARPPLASLACPVPQRFYRGKFLGLCLVKIGGSHLREYV